MEIILYVFVGSASFAAGWYLNAWLTRRRNKAIARKMAESVRASKSRRDPASMLSYDSRQRVAGGTEEPILVRQRKVRFRSRPMRR